MALSIYHLALAIVGVCLLWSRRRRIRAPYPPGPPADPIIGHLRVLPSSNQAVVFREMSKIYGNIMYFRIPGRSYLVLNSLKTATELLDQRSGIYSDRMRLALFDIMGWRATLTLLPYGKRFQKHRRLLQEYLHEKQCLSYQPLQTQHAHHLLAHLMDHPGDWMKHIERFAAALVIKIVYGMDLADNDPYLDITEKALISATSCGAAGGTPIDFIPLLRYLPSWFPGTYYAFKARSFRTAIRKMHEYPFEFVQRQMKEGTAQPSFLSFHLDQLHGVIPDEEHVEDLQGSAGAMFSGGADTTAAAISLFIFAMVLFPDVQEKAQQEIDDVVGKDRLPEMGDRASLPYIDAVLHEVLRWNTVLPNGIPHRSTEDDIYNGMYIPKGTVVIANAYAILRDETIYSDPDSFNPSRYLPKPEGKAEPYSTSHFGFGRRICPGQYLADASLYIVIVSILATLNIGRVKDENGAEIVPELELMTGVTSHPKPFPCTIKPRDKKSESMIRQAQLWDGN
ncbi:cytochrome P450 [Cyathus striatus]|nr:cytochrome P450 [Cyathus striatus]